MSATAIAHPAPVAARSAERPGLARLTAVELRKMVWPTRQETWRTTLVVFVFVLALAVFFWIVDMGLAWGARHVTGQGG